MRETVLIKIRRRLNDDRVYQWSTNVCLMIALGCAVAGQMWPRTTFAVTVIAIVMGITALGIYVTAATGASDEVCIENSDSARRDRRLGK